LQPAALNIFFNTNPTLRPPKPSAILEVGLLLLRIQNDTLREYLEARYLDFKTHAQIAAPKNYSSSWCRKTHRRGLMAVQALLDEEKSKV